MKNNILRVKKWTAIILLALIVFLLCGCGESSRKRYPEPTEKFFVNDFADVMTPEDEQTVYAYGVALQEKTEAQVVVVTVESLDGQDASLYALELGDEWGVGDEEKDNGIVILLSEDDREIEIAIGEGLEGALPDSKTGRIIDTYAMPYLTADDFSTALTKVCSSLVNEVYIEYGIEIDKDYTPIAFLPEVQQETENEGGKILVSWIVLIVLVAIYVAVFGRHGLFIFGAPRFFGGGFHFNGGSFGGGSFGGFKGGGGSFGGGGAGRKF